MTELILIAFQIWAVGALVVAVAFLVLTVSNPLPLASPEHTTAVMLLVACLWPITVPTIVAIVRDLGKWR